MATGKRYNEAMSRENYESRPLFQKEYITSYTAAETIRTIKGGGHQSSPLKNLVSDQLTASNVRDSVINLFSWLGLCKSKSCITISSDKAVDQKIKDGWNPVGRGYGIIVGAYDNIGFRTYSTIHDRSFLISIQILD